MKKRMLKPEDPERAKFTSEAATHQALAALGENSLPNIATIHHTVHSLSLLSFFHSPEKFRILLQRNSGIPEDKERSLIVQRNLS